MKKITLLILLILTASMVGFAQKDTSDLKTVISSNFPDNTAGFITPERLRTVSEELMRSSPNKLEDNVMSGVFTVNDSVKTTEGFFRWTGSDWASVSDDTTAWGRSGGFILPLNYSDKLSIDTGRVEGLLYPTGSVNLGTSSVPFDTLNTNVVNATSLVVEACDSTTIGQVLANTGGGLACWADPCCPLDDAYDSGGAGAGRTITADAGAVEIDGNLLVSDTVGIGTTTPTKTLEVNGESLFKYDNNIETIIGDFTLSAGAFDAQCTGFVSKYRYQDYDYNEGLYINDFSSKVAWTVNMRDTTGNVGMAVVMNKATADNFPQFSLGYQWTLGSDYSKFDFNRGGVEFMIGDTATFEIFSRATNNTIFKIEADSTVTINGQLKYVDGNEADGYVLTSDASGNATWTHTFSYGEMGFGDSTATIALTQNTPAWVTNGNNDLWSEGATTLEGITYSNDSLICNADGIYEINLRISGDIALNDVLKVGVYKNGSLSCTCQGQITSPLAGTVEITYVDILSLSADDALQVYITNTANNNDFDAISAKMTMHKVGN